MTFRDVDHFVFDRAGVTTLPGMWGLSMHVSSS